MKLSKKFLGTLVLGTLIVGASAFAADKPDVRVGATITSRGIYGEKTASEIGRENTPGYLLKKVELDDENGVWVYEVATVNGTSEKKVKIDGKSGDVLGIKEEKTDDLYKGEKPSFPFPRAQKLALKESDNGQFKKIELDREDGKFVYKVDVQEPNRVKKYVIDGTTGAILSTKYDD